MDTRVSRRGLLRASLSAAGGVLLASCAPKTEEPVTVEGTPQVAEDVVSPTAATAREVNIQLLTDEDIHGYPESNAFMELHPEVKIEVILADQLKLDSMIAAGTPPDIFIEAETLFPMHLQNQTILDLQPFVEADQFDLSAYFPNVLKTYQAADGNLHGLGAGFSAQLFYYNVTLFEEAGLEVPDEIWTWTQVMEAATALTQGEGANKTYGIMPYDPWYAQFPCVWQSGGDIFGTDNETCLMDQPEAIAALDYIAGFVHKGLAPSPQQVVGMGATSGQLFGSSRVAMFPAGHWVTDEFPDTPGLQWEVTVCPKNKTAATFLHQAFWVISRVTEEPRWCWEWLKFACGPEMSLQLAVDFGAMSSHISVAKILAENPPETASTESKKLWKALAKAGDVARSSGLVTVFNQFIDNAWSPTLDRLFAGDLTAKEAGETIAAEANKILAQ